MKYEWSLNCLYKGYEDENFQKDFESIDNRIKALKEVVDKATEKTHLEGLLSIIKELETFETFVTNLYSYLALRSSVNTTEEETSRYTTIFRKKYTQMIPINAKMYAYIASIESLEQLIKENEALWEYEFFLLDIKESQAHRLDEKVEEVIGKMDLTGGRAWEKLFDYLTSTLKVDYKGDVVTLPEIRNKANDEDQEVRKEAYEAELRSYEKIKDSIAFALNNIKSQVSMVTELRGYESPLDMTLKQSNMKRETLDAMFSSMRKYLPKFHEYLKAKASMLGHKNGLPWYDLTAPVGEFNKKYSIEEAKEYLVSAFSHFSEDMVMLIERAFNEEWIDFLSREGKVGGAFCLAVPSKKQSRILTNYNYNFDSINTLAHELGHAYHNLQIENNSPLNQDYSMPVAETASTFNENVIIMKAILEGTKEEKLSLIENLLSNTTQIICDIYSRFLFEDTVFHRCEEEFLTADRLKEIMIQAQKEAYGDGLDENYLHPYMWCCKGHYYSSSLSYYNFPYAFGGLFSMGLYTMFEEEGESFVPKYKELLNKTPIKTVEDVAKMVGIDLTTEDFWDKSLSYFATLIDEFISLSK